MANMLNAKKAGTNNFDDLFMAYRFKKFYIMSPDNPNVKETTTQICPGISTADHVL
jgi:hypothetical protein